MNELLSALVQLGIITNATAQRINRDLNPVEAAAWAESVIGDAFTGALADPRVYPDGPVYDSQKRTVTRYAKKVEALNLLGVPLVELWESDLKQSIVDTIRNALHGIALG